VLRTALEVLAVRTDVAGAAVAVLTAKVLLLVVRAWWLTNLLGCFAFTSAANLSISSRTVPVEWLLI
jgi:hypothetical protein